MMAPGELDNLIAKYLAGKCTEAESDFISAWYSSLGSSADNPDLHVTEDRIAAVEERMLKNLRRYVGMPAPPFLEKQRSLFWPYTGIAASFIVCLAIGYYFLFQRVSPTPTVAQVFSEEFKSIENFSSATKRVILPDGSIVQMSPDSRIKYSDDPDSPSRELFLKGEAYFDVAHNSGRPFLVYAGDVVTRVLGTSFIVRTEGDDNKVTVSVKTGKVTVYLKNASHKKTVLVPNQEAVYDAAKEVVSTQVVPVALDERQENVMEMHFDETPVSEVLSMLRNTYDIDIIFQEESQFSAVIGECCISPPFTNCTLMTSPKKLYRSCLQTCGISVRTFCQSHTS